MTCMEEEISEKTTTINKLKIKIYVILIYFKYLGL